MDNLRSFAICLVIIFHLTLLYTEFTPVQNPIPESYNGIFMGISSLINGPLLNSIMFFIAGFFAFETYRRKGGSSFVKDKLVKLGIPYIGGLIVLAPLTQYIANHSWKKGGNFFQFWLKDFFLPKVITPHHLWFIGILLVFFVVSIPFFKVLQKNKKEAQHKRFIQNVIVLLFLMGMFFAYFGLGFFYTPYDFISIYIINFPPVVLPVYASYFILGIYAYFQNWFSIKHKQYIFPWAIMYIVFLILNIGTFIVIPTALADNHPLLAIAFIGSTFTGIMLLIVVFKRFANKKTNFASWISKESYGAYIFHYLIVFLVVYLMRDIPIPFMAKYIFQCIFCPCIIWSLAGLLKGYTPLKEIL
jgi:peptidoglycan/LPS O-acetylase OafA/YrhL